MSKNRLLGRSPKSAVFLLCLFPLALLVWNAFSGNLSANPIDDITDTTGRWTLRFLLISLAVRPVRQITGIGNIMQFRRMLGLFAFFYSVLHVSVYVVLDYFFDFAAMLQEIPEKPFIAAGFTAFVAMIPLAITSTKKWIGRLGGKRWQLLHRLVYLSAIGGVLHYLWITKVVEAGPVAYAAALALLLGYRVAVYFRPDIVRRANSQERLRDAAHPSTSGQPRSENASQVLIQRTESPEHAGTAV